MREDREGFLGKCIRAEELRKEVSRHRKSLCKDPRVGRGLLGRF